MHTRTLRPRPEVFPRRPFSAGARSAAPAAPRSRPHCTPLACREYGSDEAILAALLAGESEALWRAFFVRFEALVRATLRRTARAYGVCLGDDEVDDLHAGVAAQLLANDRRALRSFDPSRGTPLRAWIVVVAERRALTYLRARRVRIRRGEHLLAVPEVRDLLPHCGPNPEEMASRRQLLDRLRGALDVLGRRQRELFDLFFAEGLELAEVAARMGTTLQTVRACRHKMERRLVRAIHGNGEPEPLASAA